MRRITKDELIKALMRDNATLQAQQAQSKSDIDYIAMMSDIDMPAEEGADEQAL